MQYGWLDLPTWRRLLHSDSLAIRLCALRALAARGQEGAWALLREPTTRADEVYPWMWALCRCADADLLGNLSLTARPSHGPLAGARFLLRRRPRRWTATRTRAQCVEAMLEALHPLAMLACAVRLLEMHGEKAIPALLEVFRLRPQGRPALGLRERLDETAECAAWALGRLGRIIVPEVVQAYGGASKRVRGHLAAALWYLGKDALKALPVLLGDPSPQAGAALLALEEAASVEMVERRRGPVWLDEQSVQALAGLAFADEDRVYAAASLGCFGPAALKGLPILRHLARDPEVEVRRMVARGMGWGGRREGLSLLLTLLQDEDAGVCHSATRAQLAYFDSPEQGRQVFLDLLRSGSEVERSLAALQLSRVGLPSDRHEEVLELFEQGGVELRSQLLRALSHSTFPLHGYQAELVTLLADENGSLRAAAAGLLARLRDRPEVLEALCKALWDENQEVMRKVAWGLALTGLSLKRLGIAGRLAEFPAPVLESFLQEYPHKVPWEELAAVLQEGGAEVRKIAALALGDYPDSEGIEAALEALLDDADQLVAVCAVRSLCKRGRLDGAWILLGSPAEADRSQAFEALRYAAKLPEAMMEAVRDGRLLNVWVLRLLKIYLPVWGRAGLLAEIYPRLDPPGRQLLFKELTAYGTVALDSCLELLGNSDLEVAWQALDIMEKVLSTSWDSALEWLADRGLVLPLFDLPEALMGRLHNLLASFLVRSRAWEHPRILPLLEALSRSPDFIAAARIGDCLGKALVTRPESQIADLLLEMLALHPHRAVRWTAVKALSGQPQLGARVATLELDSDPLVRLEMLALRFLGVGLDDVLLREALLLTLAENGPVGPFVAHEPAQFIQLFRFVHDPELGALALRLLATYVEVAPIELSLWEPFLTFLQGAEKLREAFVLLALEFRHDCLEQLTRLGMGVSAGLVQALKSDRDWLRLRALRAVLQLQSLPPLLREAVTRVTSDTCDEVKHEAGNVLARFPEEG